MIELLIGFRALLFYFLTAASFALLLRKNVSVPREVFRKTLHFILLGSIFVFTEAFASAYTAAAAALLFAVLLYPVLKVLEKVKGYSDLLTERSPGEIKKSLVLVFLMFSIILVLCWGILSMKYLVTASVLAWGVGDAAAALIGMKFGKTFMKGKGLSGKKTLEGFVGMLLSAFLSVLGVFLYHQPLVWYEYLPIALITAGVTAVVELYSQDGLDTVTCPLAAAVTMIPLVLLLGG